MAGEVIVMAWLIGTMLLLAVALAFAMVRLFYDREWVQLAIIVWVLPLFIGLVLMGADR